MKKRWMNNLIPFALAAACIMACRVNARAEPVLLDGILAVVNGTVITWSDLVMRERGLRRSMDDLPAEERHDMREKIIQDLIDEQLMIEEAKRMAITPDDAEIERHIEKIKADNGLTSDEALDEALAKDGLTRDDLKKNLSEEIAFLRLQQRFLNQVIQVTDQEIRAYYDTEWTGAKEGTRVEISHILLLPPGEGDNPGAERDARERIEEIKREWEKGTPFAELATRYSQDASAADGGYLGWFSLDGLRPEFAEAIFGIRPGGVAGPVKTDRGYHLLLLIARAEKELERGSPLWEEIKKTLTERKRTELFDSWIERLRKKAAIEINEKALTW
ncbi:MAG: peptidylprolyl isomerase [bacterium]